MHQAIGRLRLAQRFANQRAVQEYLLVRGPFLWLFARGGFRALQADSDPLDNVTHDVSRFDMPSVNIRQLRDTRRLKEWLRAGKTVELRERDKLIARIVPENEERKPPKEWPDFAARRKQIFGGRVLTAVDDFLKDRGRY